MIHRTLVIELVSYWSVSSGGGGRHDLDREVVRDAHGLPYLPGKVVKGLLLREALRRGRLACLGVGSEAQVVSWLGTDIPRKEDGKREPAVRLEESRYTTTAGSLLVSSATLPEAWRRWAAGAAPKERDRPIRELYRVIASTAMEPWGVVKAQTLRTIEVVVPMTLHARLTGPDDGWDAALAAALPLVRELGGDRNRGLGRCQLRLEGGDA